MSRRPVCVLALLVSIAAPGSAQQAGLRGPVAGALYHPATHSLRSLAGIPGASYLGPSMAGAVDFASVSPDGKWAVLVRKGTAVAFGDLTSATPAEQTPANLIEAVDRVVWSGDSACALLYSSTSNRLQRLHVSTAAALPDPAIDLARWGRPAVLALDRTGRRAAVGFKDQGLFSFEEEQVPGLLAPLAQPAAAGFDAAGRLYAIDAATRQLLAITGDGQSSLLATLSGPDDPAVDPVGLSVSAEGRYILVPDRATPAVRVYDAANGNLANTIGLNFMPTRLEPISAAGTFVLNGERQDEWLLILDASHTPTVYFVPALPQEHTL